MTNLGSIGRAVAGVCAVVAALGAGPSPAAAFHEATLHVEVGAWRPGLDAEVRSGRAGLAGDLVSDEDLALDDPDAVVQAALTLRVARRHTLRVEGFGLSVEGDGQARRTFTFDGRTYPVATRITSEADAAVVGVDYGFDLIHAVPAAVGLTLGVRLVTAEATVRAPALGVAGRGELEAALPALGVRVVLHPFPVPLLGSLAATARLVGGTIGDRGSFLDADVAVEWLPLPLLAARIGYRYFHGRGEDGREQAEIDLSGPYLSLTLAF